MTILFQGSPHLLGIKGLAGRIASRISSGDIEEPITSSKLRGRFSNRDGEYSLALKELEIRNCIRLEKHVNKRGRPSVFVRIHPKLLGFNPESIVE